MAYATPKTWATNDLATAAQLNQDLRDNVAFLATPPSCRVYNNANISHSSSGSFQALTFNSERWDWPTTAMHSTSSLTGRIVMPVAGKYHVGGSIRFAANSTGVRAVEIRLNGSTVIAIQGSPPVTSPDVPDLIVTCDYTFAANDYVELLAYQASGGALNVVAASNSSPEFWAHWFSL